MTRVEATLSDSQNKVTKSKMDGKADRSNGLNVYIEAKRMISANVILNEIRRSSSIGGSGITINIRIATAATAMEISLFFEITGTCPAY